MSNTNTENRKALRVDPRVDELAALNQQLAALKAKADNLKAELVQAHGAGEAFGLRFKARISIIAEAEVINYKALAERLAENLAAQVVASAKASSTSTRQESTRVALYDIN